VNYDCRVLESSDMRCSKYSIAMICDKVMKNNLARSANVSTGLYILYSIYFFYYSVTYSLLNPTVDRVSGVCVCMCVLGTLT